MIDLTKVSRVLARFPYKKVKGTHVGEVERVGRLALAIVALLLATVISTAEVQADTAQTELGIDDFQSAFVPDLVGQNNANENIGGDGFATSTIRVTQRDATVTGPFAVNVTESLTNPTSNTSLDDLMSDFSYALVIAGLKVEYDSIVDLN